ncbi:hypothetical protein HIM_11973 [Hirsutella minnesotensis 3608]|uniref:Uncharacterized protein n=1 Tax=Hirsutella minnesotensis 3608 TaxID=1043627 RepID=A0A0F8A0L1_9HYPO|nr:hypothetical protein HIM_11973 [Hirsutella minnesotensis 3608]
MEPFRRTNADRLIASRHRSLNLGFANGFANDLSNEQPHATSLTRLTGQARHIIDLTTEELPYIDLTTIVDYETVPLIEAKPPSTDASLEFYCARCNSTIEDTAILRICGCMDLLTFAM